MSFTWPAGTPAASSFGPHSAAGADSSRSAMAARSATRFSTRSVLVAKRGSAASPAAPIASHSSANWWSVPTAMTTRAVGGVEGLVGRDAGVGVAHPAGGHARGGLGGRLVHQRGQQAGQQVQLDRLPPTGAVAVAQRGQDARGGEQAGDHVHQRHAHLLRLAVGGAGHAHQPADGLEQQVVAGHGGARSRAEPGHGARDQPRVDRRQRRVVQPQPLHDAGAEVLHHHVGALGQLAGHGKVGVVGQVQRHAVLAPVHRQEVGGGAVGRVGRPQPRVSSPRPGRSTLSTVAPWSARSIVASGAARTREKSRTSRSPSGVSAMRPDGFRRRGTSIQRGMPTDTTVPAITLNDGVEIPQLGFGVFQIPPDETVEATLRAFQTGYRHIDTAAAYRNEAEVGQAFRASGLDRDEVFITTKCFNDSHGYEQAKHAFQDSIDRLELEFVDLYLIHWPVPSQDKYVETWKAFIELKEQGLIRSIGVSNFQPAHLQPDRRRDRRDAVGQPDRAAPALPAGRPAARARRPRHRDRGVEPAGPGRRARRPGADRDRRGARQDHRPGRAALAHPAGQRGLPQVGHARARSRRTSTSSTSTCPTTRWSGSRRSTPASARARTRTRSCGPRSTGLSRGPPPRRPARPGPAAARSGRARHSRSQGR